MHARLPPITFQPRSSRQLRLLLSTLQGLTLLVLMLAPITLIWRTTLFLGFLVFVVLSQRPFDSASRRTITQVSIDDQHTVSLRFADGRRIKTRLRGDSLVTPWLLVLRFEAVARLHRQTLLLGRDSLAGEEMRRLRILLRFGRLDESA
jgi:hypothetical protein